MLGPHEAGDVIVVVSDGRDNMSKLSMNKIENDLLRIGVPVLAILIASPSTPTPDRLTDPRDFVRLAEVTGGATATAGGRLDTAFPSGTLLFRRTQLISLLAHQYELEMKTPPIQKREKWEFKPNPTSAGGRLNLLYPRYLLPCTETH